MGHQIENEWSLPWRILRSKKSCFLSQHRKTLLCRVFIWKWTEKINLFKKCVRNFWNSSSVKRYAYFYVATKGDFKCFHYLNFEKNFLKNKNLKKSPIFYLKVLRSKTQHFHTKLLCQKLILRQIEWEMHNGPIAENGVLALLA